MAKPLNICIIGYGFMSRCIPMPIARSTISSIPLAILRPPRPEHRPRLTQVVLDAVLQSAQEEKWVRVEKDSRSPVQWRFSMSTVTQKLITAEEFLRMPPPEDGSKVELVRGEVVPVCRPGFQHGRQQAGIGMVLDRFGESTGHGRATVETGLVTERDPDTVKGPDISYWSAERLPLDQKPQGYPRLLPMWLWRFSPPAIA